MAARLRTQLASQLTSQLALFDVISEMLGHGNTTTQCLPLLGSFRHQRGLRACSGS